MSKEQALPLGQQWVRVPRAQGPGRGQRAEGKEAVPTALTG